MAGTGTEKRRDVFRIIAISLLAIGVVAVVVCVVCVLNYLALERAPSDGFMTLFALDAAHDRAVTSGIIAIFLLLAGSALALVSRRGKHPT